MTGKIKVEFPETGITVFAALLEEAEPAVCENLWAYLEKPVKCACYNTLSTGCLFIGKAKPPREPLRTGTQATPYGKKRKLLCDMIPGEIIFSGLDFLCCYGPETEPLLGRGPVVMQVCPDCLDDFIKAGQYIWFCQQISHVLATMIVSRGED